MAKRGMTARGISGIRKPGNVSSPRIDLEARTRIRSHAVPPDTCGANIHRVCSSRPNLADMTKNTLYVICFSCRGSLELNSSKDEDTTESQSKDPVYPGIQLATPQSTAQKRSSLLLDQSEATAKRSKKACRTNSKTSLKASTSQLPDSDSEPPTLPAKRTPKRSKSKHDITADVQSPAQRMDGVDTNDHSSSPKTNVPVSLLAMLITPDLFNRAPGVPV